MDKTERPIESPDTNSVTPVVNMEESTTNTTPSSDASKVIPTLCDQEPSKKRKLRYNRTKNSIILLCVI